MSDETPRVGTIGWQDLTVSNADEVRDFYSQVVGWEPEQFEMKDDSGDYADYSMKISGDGQPIAGICHARGSNAKLPPVWLIYITVADLDHSIAQCQEHGGKVLDGPRGMGGYGTFAVIEDPGGAVSALFQPPSGD